MSTIDISELKRQIMEHYIFEYISQKYNIEPENLFVDCMTKSENWMRSPWHAEEEHKLDTLIKQYQEAFK